MTDTAVDTLPDEAEKVRRWRYDEFRCFGFSPTDAELLALSSAELHAMADLLEAGCPPVVAARILL